MPRCFYSHDILNHSGCPRPIAWTQTSVGGEKTPWECNRPPECEFDMITAYLYQVVSRPSNRLALPLWFISIPTCTFLTCTTYLRLDRRCASENMYGTKLSWQRTIFNRVLVNILRQTPITSTLWNIALNMSLRHFPKRPKYIRPDADERGLRFRISHSNPPYYTKVEYEKHSLPVNLLLGSISLLYLGQCQFTALSSRRQHSVFIHTQQAIFISNTNLLSRFV